MDSNLRDCAFRSLVSSLRPIMNRVLGCTHREIEESVKLFYQYFFPAGPFAAKVAEASNYHLSKTLSLLFLPFLLQSGSLVLSERNSLAVMNFVIASKFVTLDALKKLHTLRVSKWYSPFDEEIDYDAIKEFFPKIPELKVVILGSYTSDNIIDIIVKSCPKLQVLDCREDCWCTVSDSGLEALSSLKSLRYVLFSYLPDEYEEEDEKLLFSPKGIASLMMALPNLIKFECPEYLMREALDIISLKNCVLPSLKSLYLEGYGAHSSTFRTANKVCTNLEELCLMVHKEEENDIADSLTEFKNLRSLTLNKLVIPLSAMKLSVYGPNLRFLDIKKNIFQVEDFLVLGSCCENLETLCIFDQCIHNDSFNFPNLIEDVKDSFFPSLLTFVYKLRSLEGLLFIFPALKNLKHLYGRVDSSLNAMPLLKILSVSHGMPNLETLVMPDLCCLPQVALNIIISLPKLKYFNLGVMEKKLITQKIAGMGLSLKIGDVFDYEPFPSSKWNSNFILS